MDAGGERGINASPPPPHPLIVRIERARSLGSGTSSAFTTVDRPASTVAREDQLENAPLGSRTEIVCSPAKPLIRSWPPVRFLRRKL